MSMSFPLVPDVATTPAEEIARILTDPGFGIHFTDHMALAIWTEAEGWHDDRIEGYHPLALGPAGAVLHYGQEIFEGLKAYRRQDGSVWLFRPDMNAARLNRSADRMTLPRLPEADFLAAIGGLVALDQAWVPEADEMSLYIRPFMFGSDQFLGVRSAAEVTFAAIASPCGPYFADGISPVKIWISTDLSRAGQGGTGAAKCGGNYAASLLATRQAQQQGCSQVLFTDAADHEWLEELGGMNVFLVTSDGRLLTPPTSGTILDGITRDSVMTLAPEFGLTVQERPISLSELLSGIGSRNVVEAFACGTAAVITPIGTFRLEREGKIEDFSLPEPFGPKTADLRRRLVDIQWGRTTDQFGWTTRVA
ncbi:MAG: branched-chain amino acid aminotransferase [Propionibacteriaceae bacterium]|jgi:branched-chain amino acid aminotransferase|nr:branched-chain amino acid aminotransferase [Propionibacteriaceae bacterium]